MRLNSLLKKTNYSLTVAIIIGIIIVVNFLSYQIFYRWDMTQNNDYSISAASKKTISNLDDIVNIKAYFSADLPAQFINLRQEVGDILDEYVNYSNNKIKVEFISPANDQATVQELYQLGIPQLQFNALEKDKYQVVNGYIGMLIKYGDKSEAIPVVQDTANLEYQLTSIIKKLTSEKLAAVGVWQGNGAANATSEISVAYKKLSELYEVKLINPATDKEIPAEITTLLIIGPKEKFSDDELKKIDAFVMRGGSLLVLADGAKVDQGLTASKNDLGLNKILESYGVKINNDLVLDIYSGVASFNQGFVSFSINYPLWPKVVNSGFDQNNAAVAKLESLILPWASSLTVNAEKVKDGKIFYLARSTDKALAQSDKFILNPQADLSTSGKAGQYNLAVEIIAKFSSAFGQNTAANPGRIVVVGDSDFIYDSFLNGSPDNLLFFQNLVDSLSLDEDLINIRSQGVTDRPIRELSDNAKTAIRYSNVFGITTIVLIFGIARYFMRRRTKFVDEI